MSNDAQEDAGARPVQTTLPGGTIFRVIEFKPGVQARNHRTDSIDYIVCMAGEIDMDLDGTVVHLEARRRAWCAGHDPQLDQQRQGVAASSRVILDRRQAVTAGNGKVLNAVELIFPARHSGARRSASGIEPLMTFS